MNGLDFLIPLSYGQTFTVKSQKCCPRSKRRPTLVKVKVMSLNKRGSKNQKWHRNVLFVQITLENPTRSSGLCIARSPRCFLLCNLVLSTSPEPKFFGFSLLLQNGFYYLIRAFPMAESRGNEAATSTSGNDFLFPIIFPISNPILYLLQTKMGLLRKINHCKLRC